MLLLLLAGSAQLSSAILTNLHIFHLLISWLVARFVMPGLCTYMVLSVYFSDIGRKNWIRCDDGMDKEFKLRILKS